MRQFLIVIFLLVSTHAFANPKLINITSEMEQTWEEWILRISLTVESEFPVDTLSYDLIRPEHAIERISTPQTFVNQGRNVWTSLLEYKVSHLAMNGLYIVTHFQFTDVLGNSSQMYSGRYAARMLVQNPTSSMQSVSPLIASVALEFIAFETILQAKVELIVKSETPITYINYHLVNGRGSSYSKEGQVDSIQVSPGVWKIVDQFEVPRAFISRSIAFENLKVINSQKSSSNPIHFQAAEISQ